MTFEVIHNSGLYSLFSEAPSLFLVPIAIQTFEIRRQWKL